MVPPTILSWGEYFTSFLFSSPPQRIKEEPKAFVVPIIDVIDDKTMEYYHGNGNYFQIGGFTWDGHFNWIDVPAHEEARRAGDTTAPVR